MQRQSQFFSWGGKVVKLAFTLDVPELLIRELEQAVRDCQLSASEFCAESVEAALSSRRLRRLPAARHGAFTSGVAGTRELKPEAGLVVHGILIPKGGKYERRN